jgi:hypothetical protein
MPVPPVLIVAPPEIVEPRGAAALKFEGASAKARGLAKAYEDVAVQHACAFFNSGAVVSTSRVDGVHLDRDAHDKLGHALTHPVGELVAGGRAGMARKKGLENPAGQG